MCVFHYEGSQLPPVVTLLLLKGSLRYQVNQCVKTNKQNCLQMHIMWRVNTTSGTRITSFEFSFISCQIGTWFKTVAWLSCYSSTAPLSLGGGGNWCMREWLPIVSTGECNHVDIVKVCDHQKSWYTCVNIESTAHKQHVATILCFCFLLFF